MAEAAVACPAWPPPVFLGLPGAASSAPCKLERVSLMSHVRVGTATLHSHASARCLPEPRAKVGLPASEGGGDMAGLRAHRCCALLVLLTSLASGGTRGGALHPSRDAEVHWAAVCVAGAEQRRAVAADAGPVAALGFLGGPGLPWNQPPG